MMMIPENIPVSTRQSFPGNLSMLQSLYFAAVVYNRTVVNRSIVHKIITINKQFHYFSTFYFKQRMGICNNSLFFSGNV
jgi:hypothetical protein